MKVTLISPNERKFLFNAGDRAPIGLAYLSAALEANGHQTEIIDLNHADWRITLDKIRKEHPDFVGISTPSSPTFKQAKRLSEELKWYTHRIIGGKGVTDRESELELVSEAVIVGDGEEAILDVLGGARGILEKKIDVNKYPIPNRKRLDNSKYNMLIQGVRTSPIVSSRGCAHACAFCGNIAKRPQFRTLDNIAEELTEIKDLGYGGVYFYDENFVSTPERVFTIGEEARKRGLQYRVEARAKTLTDEVVKALKETGCMMVAIGFESADDRVLRAIHKGETNEDYNVCIDTLHKYRLPFKGYFIMGLPEQTYASGLGTVEFARQAKEKGMVTADFYALMPFPGSPIAKDPAKYCIKVLSKDPSKYLIASNKQTRPVVETLLLSANDVQQLIDYGNRSVKHG